MPLTLYKFRTWFCKTTSLPSFSQYQEKPEQHSTSDLTNKRSTCYIGQRVLFTTNKSSRPQSTRQIRTSRQHQFSENRPLPAQSDIVFVSKASWPNLDKVLTLSCAERMCTWYWFRWVATQCGHTFGEPELLKPQCQRAKDLGGYGRCGSVTHVADVEREIDALCEVCQLPN